MTLKSPTLACTIALFAALPYAGYAQTPEPSSGWHQWRGPQQNGTTLETNLPEKWSLGGEGDLWSVPLSGRGTPVIAGDRLYVFAYRGEQADLREVLACLDAATGKTLWEHHYPDYLSDTIYDRYSIGAPSIDATTGNVFLLTSAGDLYSYTPDGEQLWHRSLMEELGRMTFPNGRTGAVALDGDLAIIHTVAANWGGEGPPKDRFYAFDKRSGELVWSSDTGVGAPFLKDNSFAPPLFVTLDSGLRIFYCVLGDGNLVCINARTGKPIWRYQLAIGGMNSAPLLHNNLLIAVHDVENTDKPKGGGLYAINVNAQGTKDESGKNVLGRDALVWSNDEIAAFSSSPVLVEGRIYVVDKTGVLYCVNADNGQTLWSEKLGTDQIHASPLYGDGKLYVPMNEGLFYILNLNGNEPPTVLSKVQLEGNCLGAPTLWNGRGYIFTTTRLYCFGYASGNSSNLPAPVPAPPTATPGKPVALQIIPAEVLLRPGESASFRVRSIDALGLVVDDNVQGVIWEKFIPPTAKVKSEMDANFVDGALVAKTDARVSAGAFKATSGDISGTIRGRIITQLPYAEDFEGYQLPEKHATEPVQFAYPPLPWIGARFKWEVRDVDGNKVLAKTTDNPLLQRAITFLGHPDESNYTLQADVMTDGNRRGVGEVGIIVQQYLVALKGNNNKLEVSSNYERFLHSTPFETKPGVWYTLKARVDLSPSGSGLISIKAWERGTPEPENWTFEVLHDRAHTRGAPGIFGLSYTTHTRVYADNFRITPNQ